jgi:hypothetical protein
MGKASLELGSMGEFPGKTLTRINKGFDALKTPLLWFYKCNSCNKIQKLEKLRTKAHSEPRDILLCDTCITLFNGWTQKYGLRSSISRRYTI